MLVVFFCPLILSCLPFLIFSLHISFDLFVFFPIALSILSSIVSIYLNNLSLMCFVNLCLSVFHLFYLPSLTLPPTLRVESNLFQKQLFYLTMTTKRCLRSCLRKRIRNTFSSHICQDLDEMDHALDRTF